MKVTMMNLVMISHQNNQDVLVLDKIKKEGWENLTYPGGHIEKGESFYGSAIREVKEETNLNVTNLKLIGVIQWCFLEERQVGLLYRTNEYYGEMIKNHREGNLDWMNYDKFISSNNKSLSMDDIMSIYEGIYQEIIYHYNEERKSIKVNRYE